MTKASFSTMPSKRKASPAKTNVIAGESCSTKYSSTSPSTRPPASARLTSGAPVLRGFLRPTRRTLIIRRFDNGAGVEAILLGAARVRDPELAAFGGTAARSAHRPSTHIRRSRRNRRCDRTGSRQPRVGKAERTSSRKCIGSERRFRRPCRADVARGRRTRRFSKAWRPGRRLRRPVGQLDIRALRSGCRERG